MSSILGIDTAIGWAHWKVRGGWKNALWTMAGYTAVLGAIIFLTVRMDPARMNMVLVGWRVGLLILQGGLLVLLAGTRVAAAVRSDITSRMIESHRLMPISPFVAVTGYLWGPTAQSVGLAAATFLIGLVVVMAGALPADSYYIPCAVIACFGVFFWVVMAFLASLVRAPAGIVITSVFVSIATQGLVLLLLPGFVPLLVPFVQGSVFSVKVGSDYLDWPVLLGLAGEGWIAAALYIGAARKYRRSEDSALSIVPGLMLLIGWVGMSAAGMAWWEAFIPRFWADAMTENYAVSLMGSIGSAILLALVPIANIARMRKPGIGLPLFALLCAAVIWPLVMIWKPWYHDFPRAYATTAVVLASFLVGCGFVLRITQRYGIRSWVAMLLWIAMVGTVPVILDSVIWGFGDINRDYALTSIASFSPGGALVMAWSDAPASVLPGLTFQLAATLWWGIMAWLTGRPRRPRQPIISQAVMRLSKNC